MNELPCAPGLSRWWSEFEFPESFSMALSHLAALVIFILPRISQELPSLMSAET